MTALSRLDAWLGKALFHPPIILVCQITRQSQYAIHRAVWFFAACHATYFAMRDGQGWGWLAFLWGYTIIALIGATAFADMEARSWGVVRLLLWIFLALEMLASAVTGFMASSAIRSIMLLFAEYAATIKTIPPRQKRERRAVGKGVISGQ